MASIFAQRWAPSLRSLSRQPYYTRPRSAFPPRLQLPHTNIHTPRFPLQPPFLPRFQTRTYANWNFPNNPRPRYQRFALATSLLSRWAARPTFYRDIGLLSVSAAGIYIYNLEEVPVSGRRRFNIIPPGLEEYVAKATLDGIREEYKGRFLGEGDRRVRVVRKVLERLLGGVEGLEGCEWEVNVVESEEQNAFVIPGGKVFVFTGILPLCKDEDGIAAVLGHEIAHVVAHHTAERMSQAPLVLLGIAFLSLFDVSLYSSKLLLDVFLSWPGSRKQEAEADYIGLLMMAQGCYRPEAAMEFWGRMEKLGQQAPPQILSTHPSNHSREDKIREWLPEARARAEQAECAGVSGYVEGFERAFGGRRWA